MSPRRLVVAVVVALAVAIPASVAWACVGVVALTSSSSTVQPGGALMVTGREFAQGVPVQIHLDALDGPVLATAPAPMDTMTSKFTISVTIPSNIASGQHFLVATQNQHDMNSGAPARTVFYVGGPAPTTPAPAARPGALASASGPSTASLLLIGLAVAMLGLLVAGVWTVASGRRLRGGSRSAAGVA